MVIKIDFKILKFKCVSHACRKIKVWFRRLSQRSQVDDNDDGKKVFTRWELDYTLSSNDKLDLLDEYLEMGEQSVYSDL